MKNRKRGAPKRKAQRRSKWQSEKRFSKRFERQTPKKRGVFEQMAHEIAEEIMNTPSLWPIVYDGHPDSPYAERKEA